MKWVKLQTGQRINSDQIVAYGYSNGDPELGYLLDNHRRDVQPITGQDVKNLDSLLLQPPAPTAEPVKGEEREQRYWLVKNISDEVFIRDWETGAWMRLETHGQWLCDRLNGKPEGGDL